MCDEDVASFSHDLSILAATVDVFVEVAKWWVDAFRVLVEILADPLDTVFAKPSASPTFWDIGKTVYDGEGVAGRIEEVSIPIVVSVPSGQFLRGRRWFCFVFFGAKVDNELISVESFSHLLGQ
jgi:hypothetical protein